MNNATTTCPACGGQMTGPKYRDDGFRYFHVYECPCGHRVDDQRPHAEWEENQRAMRSLDDVRGERIEPGFRWGREVR